MVHPTVWPDGIIEVVHPRSSLGRTLACVVTYEPDRDQLLALARDLKDVPDLQVVFIDNSETEPHMAATMAVARALQIMLVRHPQNRGVAAAYNTAAELARARQCDHLLLLDQDSRISAEAVTTLRRALDTLRADGRRVAAVGPGFVDAQSGRRFPFVRLGSGIRMRHVEHAADDLVDCDMLISSGTLIPLAALDAVGPHDESLFIDYVDVEWCARARSKGYRVFGVPAAQMQHSVGECAVKRAGRWIPLHSPMRQYYAVRNALLFARKPYLTLNWRLHLLTRALAQVAIYGTTCAPRRHRLRWLGLGLVHGMIGRSGRLGEPRRVGSESAPARPRLRAEDARPADSVIEPQGVSPQL